MSSREKDLIVTPYESALNDPFETRFAELRKKKLNEHETRQKNPS